MKFIGIDPGLHGAIAALDQEGGIVFLAETPIVPFKTTKGTTRNEYDRQAMLDLLEQAVGGDDLSQVVVGLEKVHAIPRLGKNVCPACKQARGGMSSASHFNFGMGYGLWLMALTAREMKMFEIPPQTWQKVVLHGFPDRRKAGVFLAVKALFPKQKGLKKGSGQADAILIAEYMRRKYSTRFTLDEEDEGAVGDPAIAVGEEE